jgi:hypothetical protein
MGTSATGSVYHQTYQYYLNQLQEMPFKGKEDILGITYSGDEVAVPYFGQTIMLTADGLKDAAGRQPDFADCVVICRYLIMCPRFEPKQKDWVAFRDFPDAGPLTVFWANTVEGDLVKTFSGCVDTLEKRCDTLGGTVPEMDISCDLARRFTPLPKVPLLLVFNDADDAFPAAVSLLFERRAATYLDGESQAILGHILAKRLLSAGNIDQ